MVRAYPAPARIFRCSRCSSLSSGPVKADCFFVFRNHAAAFPNRLAAVRREEPRLYNRAGISGGGMEVFLVRTRRGLEIGRE